MLVKLALGGGGGGLQKFFFYKKRNILVCEFYQILLHDSEFDNYVIDFKICCSTISKERGKKKQKENKNLNISQTAFLWISYLQKVSLKIEFLLLIANFFATQNIGGAKELVVLLWLIGNI